jgi:DNA polymerase III subunit delta'
MSLDTYSHLQPKVIKMLLNSFHKNRLAHAYLFEGQKGTKKKDIAIEFAKLLYCENEHKPCDQCINCMRIEHMNHPNVLLIEPDGNTIKKDQILYLQKEYTKTTLEEGPKVYIINDVDKMSDNAANSLLKFIEEPAKDTYTLLITENLHKIINTIISRCQVINFQPIPKEEIIQYLISNGITQNTAAICSQLTNDLDAAYEIATNPDIENIIDLVISVMRSLITKKEDPIVIFENTQVDIYNSKGILQYFLDISLLYAQDIQRVKIGNEDITFMNDLPFLKQQIKDISIAKIAYDIELFLKAKIHYEYNANTMLLIDSLFINLKKEVL